MDMVDYWYSSNRNSNRYYFIYNRGSVLRPHVALVRELRM